MLQRGSYVNVNLKTIICLPTPKTIAVILYNATAAYLEHEIRCEEEAESENVCLHSMIPPPVIPLESFDKLEPFASSFDL